MGYQEVTLGKQEAKEVRLRGSQSKKGGRNGWGWRLRAWGWLGMGGGPDSRSEKRLLSSCTHSL